MKIGARRPLGWTSFALAVVTGASVQAGETGQGSIRAMIARHAVQQGIPPALADAVVRVESRYNPSARNGRNIGLTQISYPTAKAMGYSGTPAGLLDADTNLRFGIIYLARAYRLAKGDTCNTVLKYQAGHGAHSMTAAARSYCNKIKPQIATAS